ncbi:hypothetical protein J2X68_007224 [Streptomyces sp. 3330]|nr:hypothetical protein [Streptomyces sp. 3330]
MEFGAAFPADGQALELVEKGEGLLDDVAEFAQVLDVRGALSGDDRQDPPLAEFLAVGVGVVALVAEQGFGALARTAGAAGDGRDAVDQGQGLGDVVDVGRGGDDLERGAAAVADQVVFAACLAPVDRRRTGVGTPLFSRGCVSRLRRLVTNRVRRPRSVRRAGCGAAGRRRPLAATVPGGASRSVRSRTPAQAAGVARLCRCRGRRGCPADSACPLPAVALATARARAAAAARSAPTSHRPRSTAECSHHHEQPNH